MNPLENDHFESEEEKLKREIREEKHEVEELKDVLHREDVELHQKEEKLEELEKHHPIKVSVNHQPVEFKVHVATGEQIKLTAIAQDVKIKEDFNLFEKVDGKQRPVGDGEDVKLCDGQHFKAVAPDDNSMF
jgi:hypothetical protein